VLHWWTKEQIFTNKILSWDPEGCLTQRENGRLTVGHNITLTMISSSSAVCGKQLRLWMSLQAVSASHWWTHKARKKNVWVMQPWRGAEFTKWRDTRSYRFALEASQFGRKEAEEFTVLVALTKQRLVKTKFLFSTVKCRLSELAIALSTVVTVCTTPINMATRI
jgi:hypothetical protein